MLNLNNSLLGCIFKNALSLELPDSQTFFLVDNVNKVVMVNVNRVSKIGRLVSRLIKSVTTHAWLGLGYMLATCHCKRN